jgi:hypothetical protein
LARKSVLFLNRASFSMASCSSYLNTAHSGNVIASFSYCCHSSRWNDDISLYEYNAFHSIKTLSFPQLVHVGNRITGTLPCLPLPPVRTFAMTLPGLSGFFRSPKSQLAGLAVDKEKRAEK